MLALFSLLGAFFRSWLFLARLLGVFGSCWSFFSRFGSLRDGFWSVQERFWRLRGLIFRSFKLLLRALAPAGRGWSQRYKTLAGVVRNAHRSMLAIQRMTQKTNKNRPGNFSNKLFGQERVQIRIWSAPSCLLYTSPSPRDS